MDLLSRFHSREDFHQSVEFAAVMEAIGWSSIPVSGARVAVRQLGPVSVAKMQRATFIDARKLLALQSRIHIFRLIIEPACVGIYVDPSGKKHNFSFLKDADSKKAIVLFSKTRFFPTSGHYTHSKTAILDLMPTLPEIVMGFAAKTRYNIKIAQRSRNTYTVHRFDGLTKTQKDQFFSLHTRWATEKKIYGYTNTFLNIVIRKFKRNGFMISAMTDGEYSGGMMVLIHDRIAYYFYTCTSDIGKAAHVPTGLTYQAILLAKRQGADIFDFCSMFDERYPKENPRWKGFSQFKSRFNPTPVYYPPSFSKWL